MKNLLLITTLFIGFATFGQTKQEIDQHKKDAAEYLTKFLNHRDNITNHKGHLKYFAFDETIELYNVIEIINPLDNKRHSEISTKQTIKSSEIKSIDFNPINDGSGKILLMISIYMNTGSFKEIKQFKKNELPKTEEIYSKVLEFYNIKPITEDEALKLAFATKILFDNSKNEH